MHRIVCVGNSMTFGYRMLPGQSYPSQLAGLLGSNYEIINSGSNSKDTGWIIGHFNTLVKNYYNGGGFEKFIVVAWEVTNDLAFGATADEAYARMVQVGQWSIECGPLARFVCVTVLPRHIPAVPPFEASRLDVNGRLVASYAGAERCAIAHVAGDARIGPDGKQEDTAYYMDRVHPAPAGAEIVATYVAAAIHNLG